MPGYDIYFWIDADAWIQDDRFYGQRLCVPYPPYEPISIVQLAGPGKDLVHELATLDGGSIRRRLTFEGA